MKSSKTCTGPETGVLGNLKLVSFENVRAILAKRQSLQILHARYFSCLFQAVNTKFESLTNSNEPQSNTKDSGLRINIMKNCIMITLGTLNTFVCSTLI